MHTSQQFSHGSSTPDQTCNSGEASCKQHTRDASSAIDNGNNTEQCTTHLEAWQLSFTTTSIYETLILREGEGCHVSSSQWTLKWSKLVKSGQKVKEWSKERGLFANIDIFGYLYKIGLPTIFVK